MTDGDIGGGGGTADRDYRVADYVIFFVAVLFLLGILAAGFRQTEIQTNILYLVVLSLSCSMVFAFLPYDARFEYKTVFRAGGTAAIFGFCLFMTMAFTEKDYLKNKLSADSQITSLKEIIDAKDQELETLRIMISKNGSASEESAARASTAKDLVRQIELLLQSMHADLNEGLQYSSAARDNSSDAATCSMRGSQSLAALSRAAPRIEAVQSSLASLANTCR